MSFKIITDSTTDLPNKLVKELDVEVVPLKFYINDQEYVNYPDHRMLSPEDFYKLVKDGAMPTTAQVNPDEYIEVLKPMLDKGEDVLIIAFSSALSGTFNSARIAAEILTEEYPNRKILVNDTKAASLGEGLIVYLANEQRKLGKTIDQVNEYINQIKGNVAHWFTVDDIKHLRRGGRISSVASIVAQTLRIKPILHVSDEGKLIPRFKALGRRKAILSIFNQMKKTALPNQETIFIGHADCLDDANLLADLIYKEYNVKPKVIDFIGPVIGAHAGYATLALFFLAEAR